MGLKEYRAKRDFQRTAEPAGRSRASAESRSFIIQKHAASHLHYDFRLEMDGVLKSWAVPKGFPTKRGDRRLAVEVEDHPIEYGGFEGTIPEGNYGGGTVMLWDRGTYSVFGDDPVGALKAGKIHFVLAGKKLKGEWTLVRMRNFGGSKPQWLLLKSGEDLPPLSARNEDRSVLSNRTMDQIAGARNGKEWTSNRQAQQQPRSYNGVRDQQATRLQQVQSPPTRSRRQTPTLGLARRPKDSSRTPSPSALKFGLNLGELPDRKPEFVEPMKALLLAELPKGRDWLYEIKFDGVRALAIKSGRSVELISRSGKDLGAKYPEVVEALKALTSEQAVVDGEVVAVDDQGRSAFQLLQSYQNAGRNKPPLFYYVFDLIQLNGKDLAGVPLWQRKEIAQQLIADAPGAVRFSGSIRADSQKIIKELKSRGLEGLIAKRRDSKYEPGRRSGAWVKFKWTNEQEFVIGGYTRPKGARSHFGAILVGYYEQKRLRFAAKVGTGFDEKTLGSLFARFRKLVQPDCPFVNLPERIHGSTSGLSSAEMKRCTWLLPELVRCVSPNGRATHHLRQPAYLGLREDKKPQEVVRERPA